LATWPSGSSSTSHRPLMIGIAVMFSLPGFEYQLHFHVHLTLLVTAGESPSSNIRQSTSPHSLDCRPTIAVLAGILGGGANRSNTCSDRASPIPRATPGHATTTHPTGSHPISRTIGRPLPTEGRGRTRLLHPRPQCGLRQQLVSYCPASGVGRSSPATIVVSSGLVH